MSSSTAPAITDSFCYDPAKTITRATMMSSFPTTTHCYMHPYPTDQIWERGKNISVVADGETFSDPRTDDLIYATLSMLATIFLPMGTLMGMP
jgi:hypothetical protein